MYSKSKSIKSKSFYLIPRKRKEVTVYYYRLMDENNQVIGEWSTGCIDRDDALLRYAELKENGELIPKQRGKKSRSDNPRLFKDYYKNWYLWEKDKEPECPIIQQKIKSKKGFSRQTAMVYRSQLSTYIMPHFGDFNKNRITTGDIQDWLLELQEEHGITARTANNAFNCLRTMLIATRKRGDIKTSPYENVEKLPDDGKKRDILRWSEVDKLFNPDTADQVWKGEPIAYLGTLTAASTGMRTGELRGLLFKHIHKDHITVQHSASALDNSLGETKARKVREVPITEQLYNLLTELAHRFGNESGYVFSLDNGKTPLNHKYFRDHFYDALSKIKIGEQAVKERNLVFHSWRIFYNTVLQLNDIPEAKIRAILGHETKSMTEHYTNIPVEQYQTETRMTIPEIQLRIISGKKSKLAINT